MGSHLTADEWQRIEAFAQKPAYLRRPEHLLPEDAADDEEPADPITTCKG